jgi:hypothetical protein
MEICNVLEYTEPARTGRQNKRIRALVDFGAAEYEKFEKYVFSDKGIGSFYFKECIVRGCTKQVAGNDICDSCKASLKNGDFGEMAQKLKEIQDYKISKAQGEF